MRGAAVLALGHLLGRYRSPVTSFDLVVLGDVNPDLVLRGGDVTPAFGQAEHLVDDASLTVGGSGAIVACGAVRLGLQVAICGVVGDDLFGRFIRDELEARGVDTRGLAVDAHRPTGVTVVLSRPDDRALMTGLGTIGDLRPDLIDPELLRSARHVHVSSYFLQRRLAPGLPALFDEVRSGGVTTSVDPNWDPSGSWDAGLGELLERTDLFLPNDIEAGRIARTSDVDVAIERLVGDGRLVVVKTGVRGAVAGVGIGGGVEVHRVPAMDIEVVDTTGAGDSFDAGLLAGWLGGRDLDDALRAGERLRCAVDARTRGCRRAAHARRGRVARPRGEHTMIVCLAANPSIDKLFEIERLVKGDIHRPSGFLQVAGGKGLNVARATAALGAPVTAVPLLRGRAGRWLEDQLSAEGVTTAPVWAQGENRSSLSVADRETGGLTEFYEHGAVVPTAAWIELMHTTAQLFDRAVWLTISGSLPRGAPDEGYRDLVTEGRAAGVQVAVDCEGDRLRLALEAAPDVVKVNQTEARGLLGVPTARREEALAAARKLRALAGGDGHAALVTRGAEGVVLAAPDGSLYEGVLYERGRYPVGSGDAFLAGLVTGLAGGEPWDVALCSALGAATANAEIPGAGRLEPARARDLAARAEVRLV